MRRWIVPILLLAPLPAYAAPDPTPLGIPTGSMYDGNNVQALAQQASAIAQQARQAQQAPQIVAAPEAASGSNAAASGASATGSKPNGTDQEGKTGGSGH